MEAHAKFEANQAFVIKSQDITKIWKLLENEGMVVDASISCSDQLVRKFTDCEALIKYDNSKRMSITAIEISSLSREPYATAEISIGRSYYTPISVSIRGEESSVASMRMALTDIIDGIKPWYSRFAIIDLWYILTSIFIAGLFILQMMVPSNTPKPGLTLDKAFFTLAIIIAIAGSLGGIYWGINKGQKYCFPRATFVIGQGEKEYLFLEQIRWVVVIGFVVSVVSSIVVAMFLPT